MSSVRKIASRVGVSAATVSRVINNDPGVSDTLRERVLAAANRIRYVPRVGRKSTTNIAFVYTDGPTLGSPFDAALLQGMGQRMEELGFDLMILNAAAARLPDESFSQMFMRKGVRGAVLRATARSRHVCEQIAAEGFPAVVVGERFCDANVSYIYSDSLASSRQAVEHLVDLGHRRIAMCANVVEDSDHADRVGGYRQALASRGIEADERLIVRAPASREGGAQAINQLMGEPEPPTAVYLADPMAAAGAMNAACAMGRRVPGELSVVGFDDADLRLVLRPRMTAVCQDTPRMGREAFETLHQIIRQPGRIATVRRVLPTIFELNESTGRPRCEGTPLATGPTTAAPAGSRP